jgi:hypothetical protein
MFANSEDVASTCSVFLSVLLFDESEDDMMRSCQTDRLTYKLGESTGKLRAPYTLTYWDTDHLYLCLPMLSCSPKAVRFCLNIPSQGEEAETGGNRVQTLAEPMYFPSSTPRRSPRILYRASPSSKDAFVLALDSFHQADNDGGNDYPPMVVEWKVDGKTGWRAWDEDADGEERGLDEQTRTYEMLRGSFIDADRRFNVVVRSGLNWMKKAFLSCA